LYNILLTYFSYYLLTSLCAKEHPERPRLRAGEHSKVSHSPKRLLRERPTFSKSVMVSCGVETRVYGIVFCAT